jgi:hypothetical protein
LFRVTSNTTGPKSVIGGPEIQGTYNLWVGVGEDNELWLGGSSYQSYQKTINQGSGTVDLPQDTEWHHIAIWFRHQEYQPTTQQLHGYKCFYAIDGVTRTGQFFDANSDPIIFDIGTVTLFESNWPNSGGAGDQWDAGFDGAIEQLWIGKNPQSYYSPNIYTPAPAGTILSKLYDNGLKDLGTDGTAYGLLPAPIFYDTFNYPYTEHSYTFKLNYDTISITTDNIDHYPGLLSNFTLTATGEFAAVNASANLTSSFSTTVIAGNLALASANLTSNVTLASASINYKSAQADLSTAFTQDQTLLITRQAQANLVTAFTQISVPDVTRNASSNLVINFNTNAVGDSMAPVNSGSIDANANFTLASVGGIIYENSSAMNAAFTIQVSADVEHDASSNTSTAFTIDATGRLLKEASIYAENFATLTASANLTANANTNLTSAFHISCDALTAAPVLGEVYPNAFFAVGATGGISTDVFVTLTSQFSTSCSATNTSALQATAALTSRVTVSSSATNTPALQASANLVHRFTSVAVGNRTAGGRATITSQFAVTPNARLSNVRAASTLNVISILTGNLLLVPKQDLNLTVYVPDETRGYLVLPETRSFIVDYEDRIGNVLPESRLSTVESETRINILL